MYIEPVQTYYSDSSGSQATKRARFLILLQLESETRLGANPSPSPWPIYGVVRPVALRQLGAFMMGRARLHSKGKWESVSGAYGNDGLPRTVATLPPDARRLPADLAEAWSKGGGWNGAGSEAPLMKEWALEALCGDPETVIFRVYRKPIRETTAPECVAIFPYQLGDSSPSTCGVYQHIGQHGIGDPSHMMQITRRATPAEFESLKRELESAPYYYRFNVRQKIPANAYRSRILQLDKINRTTEKKDS